MPIRPQRISGVGTTGSGKTTLARRLSGALRIPHIELDTIYWDANREPLPVNELRLQTSQALACNAWVVDGNYSKVRHIVCERADTVVWLDYRLPRILYQLFLRTNKRILPAKNCGIKTKNIFVRNF